MDPVRLLESLAEAQAEVVLVGGLAAVLHGSSIVTQDIDLCYRRESVACERLLQVLASFHPEIFPRRSEPVTLRAELLMSYRMLHLKTSAGRVDLLAEVPGLGTYEEIIRDADFIRLGSREIAALSLDQLIRSKSAMNRVKDRDHLDILRELRRRTGD